MPIWAMVLAAAVAAGSTGAAAQTLVLRGLTGPSVTLTAADIRSLPHVDARLAVHGRAQAFSGVPVGLLLAKVNAPAGEAMRGPALADIVLARACDGYRVAFSLSELDPAVGDEGAVLADARDGRPMAPPEGPFRLVLPADKRPARSARCVTALEVLAIP